MANRLNDLLTILKKRNIVVDNKRELLSYIKNYNFHRIVTPFLIYSRSYDTPFTSSDIINFYNLNSKISLLILHTIFNIEKKLSTFIAYVVIDMYHPQHNSLFKISKKELQNSIFCCVKDCGQTFDGLISRLSKFCSINYNTRAFELQNKNNTFLKWQNIPFDVMCLSWSFYTTTICYKCLNPRLRIKILQKFNCPYIKYEDELTTLLDLALLLRNLITHNNPLISNIEYASDNSLTNLYNSIYNTNLSNLKLIEASRLLNLLDKQINIEKNIKSYISSLNAKKELKNLIKKTIINE